MQTQQMLIASFTLGELIEAIKPLLKGNFQAELKDNNSEKGETLLTRDETAKMLNITLPTLNIHTSEGKLKSYNIGRRVYYKHSDIIAALKPNIKKG